MHGLLRASPKAAARQHRLDLDLVGCQTENLSDRHMLAGLELAPEPGQGPLAVPAQIAIQRLHRSMREIGEYKFRFNHALRAGKRPFSITFYIDDFAGTARERSIVLDDLVAAAALCTGIVPRDPEHLSALPGRPETVRIDRDARRNLLHIDNTRHCSCGCVIDGRYLGAEPRWSRHQHSEHSGFPDVDCELGGTIGFDRAVEPVDATLTTDQSERGRLIQRRVVWNGQPRGRFRELAEPSLPAGGVAQDALLNRDFGRRHGPRLRRRLHQHDARGRAGLAHLLVGIRDRT